MQVKLIHFSASPVGFRVLELNHPSAELAVGLIFTTIPIYLTKQPDTGDEIEQKHEFKCYACRGGGGLINNRTHQVTSRRDFDTAAA